MQEKLNQKVLSNRLNCDVHSWRVINWPHKVFVFQHLQKMGQQHMGEAKSITIGWNWKRVDMGQNSKQHKEGRFHRWLDMCEARICTSGSGDVCKTLVKEGFRKPMSQNLSDRGSTPLLWLCQSQQNCKRFNLQGLGGPCSGTYQWLMEGNPI